MPDDDSAGAEEGALAKSDADAVEEHAGNDAAARQLLQPAIDWCSKSAERLGKSLAHTLQIIGTEQRCF